MAIVPGANQELVNFCDSHADAWSGISQNLGLTQLEVDGLRALTDSTIQAMADAVAARDASKAATTAQNVALADLDKRIRQLVKKVVAFAANQPNPGTVYSEAQLPLPKVPTELPAPTSPTNGRVDLNSGEIALQWDGSLFGGTYYIVERAMQPVAGAPSAFEYTANVQKKKYTDQNVPVGFASIQYRIRAFRNTLESSKALLITVPLGTVGAPTMQEIAAPGTPVNAPASEAA